MTTRELPTFSLRAHGIPAGVVVDSFHQVAPYLGSPWACASDLDYYGYTLMEWHLVDRRGYPAEWLDRLLTPEEREDIDQAIIRHYRDLT